MIWDARETNFDKEESAIKVLKYHQSGRSSLKGFFPTPYQGKTRKLTRGENYRSHFFLRHYRDNYYYYYYL